MAILLFVLLTSAAWSQSNTGQPAIEPGRTLTVTRFEFEGSQLLGEAELQELVRPYLGQALTFEELRSVAQRITEAHLSKGYKLARAYLPEQSYTDGVVRLALFQGKIDKVEIEGARYHSEDLVAGYFEDIVARGDYIDQDIVRSLLLVSELPDLKARATLKPGGRKGTSTLVVQVEDRRPLEVSLSYNNYGSRQTSEHRAGLTLAANDLSGAGDRLAVTTVLGFPTDTTTYVTASYDRPLNTCGTRLGVSYSNSAYAVGGALEVLDVRGDADIFQLSLGQALERTLTHQSDLDFSVSRARVVSQLLGQTFSEDEYLAGRLAYSGRWLSPGDQTALRLAASHGWVENTPIPSRVGIGGTFSKLNLDFIHVHRLAAPYSLSFRGSGQLGTEMPSAEQFAVGGPYTVRGYPQGELLGDSAYNASLEFRWSPLNQARDRLGFVAFYDVGTAVLNRPQAGERKSRSLSGAGVGMRFRLNDDTSGRLDLGFPLAPGRNSVRETPVIYAGLSTRL